MTLKAAKEGRNLFEGVIPQAVEGEYEVRLLPPPVLEGGLPSTTFGVNPPAGERERTQMNEAELVRAAATSGGKFYTPFDVESLSRTCPSRSRSRSTPTRRSRSGTPGRSWSCS